MTNLQINSIQAALTLFLKDIPDADFIKLTESVCYQSADKKLDQHTPLAQKFFKEFLTEEVYNDLHYDATNKTAFFTRTQPTKVELFRHLKISLMQEAFIRLKKLYKEKPMFLTKSERGNLKEILEEHQTMLNYQLEDEDYIRNIDDDDDESLLKEKKRHQKFLMNFKI